MGRNTMRRGSRSALTREMLLPLSTEKGRSLSLEHHMALAVVRSGSGDCDQGVCLCYELSISRSLCEARLHRVPISTCTSKRRQATHGRFWRAK